MLRNYQIEISKIANQQLSKRGWTYLAMEMRTGKTLTALNIAKNYSKILFVTKKKAIPSIQNDIEKIGVENIDVINYESLHKIKGSFDLYILDESHSCFVGETLINGVKIKDIKLGSLQKSFNFVKGIYEKKKVLNIFKNPINENLIKIKCNGKEIVCTENHKIFTKRGWVKAKLILPEDELQVV